MLGRLHNLSQVASVKFCDLHQISYRSECSLTQSVIFS